MPRGGTAPACDEKPWGGGLGTSYNIYDSIKIYGTSAANQNINAYSKWKPQTDLIQPKPRKKAPLSLGEGFGRCSVGSPADKGQRNSIFKAYGVKKRGPIKAKLMPPEEAAPPFKMARTAQSSKRSSFKMAVLDAEHSVAKTRPVEEPEDVQIARSGFFSAGGDQRRSKKKNRTKMSFKVPIPPAQIMQLDGIYSNTELQRPPSRGGEFAEKTREEVMLEKKREVKIAQQDAFHAMRSKKVQPRPPCRQKEPNALVEMDELLSFKSGTNNDIQSGPEHVHNFQQIHGHRDPAAPPAPPNFNFHTHSHTHSHKKNNSHHHHQDFVDMTFPDNIGERPPSRHKTPPKALGLELPVFDQQPHQELIISGKSSVISHTAGHSKVASLNATLSDEGSEFVQLHGGAILFSDSHNLESGEQSHDVMEVSATVEEIEKSLGQLQSQTLNPDAWESRRAALNKSLNNTSPGLKQQLAESKRGLNDKQQEKEALSMASPLNKSAKAKQRPSKRLHSANDNSGLREIKRDNFLRGGTAPKLSPSEKAKPLKPISLVAQDSPPFPSTSQLEKYKRAVLASPNERTQTTFQGGFSLTAAARQVGGVTSSAGKGSFRKAGKAGNELFKIIRQKNTPVLAQHPSLVKTSGLKFESNLASDFLNLFHQD